MALPIIESSVAAPPDEVDALAHMSGLWNSNNHVSINGKDIRTISEMIWLRSIVTPSSHILSFQSDSNNFEDFSARDLDLFSYRASREYALKFPARVDSGDRPRIIAILGPSNLSYVVAMFALWQLGHTIMLLSPEISKEAQIHLLRTQGVHDLVFHKSLKRMAVALKSELPEFWVHGSVEEISWKYRVKDEGTHISKISDLNLDKETDHLAFILHTSPVGSENMPRPLFFTHKVLLTFAEKLNVFLRGYSYIPLYEQHGILSMLRALHAGVPHYQHSASSQITSQSFVQTMRRQQFGALYCGTSQLKVLAKSEEAVRALAKLEVVLYGASTYSTSLGDEFTKRGVFMVVEFGTPEIGPIMSSIRVKEDNSWQYMRMYPMVRPNIKFEAREDGLFELIVLKNLSTRAVTANRPDGSFATSYLFQKHPTEDSYRFVPGIETELYIR